MLAFPISLGALNWDFPASTVRAQALPMASLGRTPGRHIESKADFVRRHDAGAVVAAERDLKSVDAGFSDLRKRSSGAEGVAAQRRPFSRESLGRIPEAPTKFRLRRLLSRAVSRFSMGRCSRAHLTITVQM